MGKMKLEYSAYTGTQDGQTFAFDGTVRAALREAESYAYEAFPAWIKGYGPKLVVRDAETKEILAEEKL